MILKKGLRVCSLPAVHLNNITNHDNTLHLYNIQGACFLQGTAFQQLEVLAKTNSKTNHEVRKKHRCYYLQILKRY